MRPLLLTCLAVCLLSSFQDRKKNKVKLPPTYVLIPGGVFWFPVDTHTEKDSMKRIAVSSFYVSKYEVNNRQYREFFAEVSGRLTKAEKEKIACDTAGWNRIEGYTRPLRQQYDTHPFFDDYPVVNVPYEGAVRYCSWLQQKMQQENPVYEIQVKLPSRAEWIWAAMGGRSQAMFPWANYYLRDKNGKPLCNFKTVNDYSIHRNRNTGKPEIADIPYGQNQLFTATVKSFTPNDFGLYNMCGNAAEMISEKGRCIGGSWNDYGGDVHIRAERSFDGPTATVGFRPVILVKEK